MKIPPEQEAIHAKCFHPSGKFVAFPKDDVEASIPERFEKIVGVHSDRLAVKMADRALTYDQLNKRANAIAHAIILESGASQQPIALLFDPGIEAVAAMLGALKSGKCYVPLDPSFPLSNISSILENSQAELIVSGTGTAVSVAKAMGNDIRVLNVDNLSSGLSERDLDLAVAPETPAFIIYTSGSTGRPKGVLHTHRTALHAAMILTNLIHVCALDRIALSLSHSFSAAIRQIFGTLLNGAMLLPFDLKREGISDFPEWLDQEAITVCGLTGSMFRQFLSQLADTNKTCSSLRVCFAGSEAVSKNDVDRYKKQLSDHTILATNMGLNEAGSIAHLLIDKDTEINEGVVPAGYNAADKEIILLNDAGEKIGFDTTGEIVVKSDFLSPGYWRQPELTATKFIPDPSSHTKRIYFTGDLGRVSPDGCLHYLGRKDFTVKIRGYNVETPKVEAALLEHPGIKQAAVVPRQNRKGDTSLVAYLVPTPQCRTSADQLRLLLKETLPDYMIPSIYVELEVMPVTATGKIDRKALPEPGDSRPRLDVSYVAPRNEIEKKLVGIWENALDVRPIGIHDSFFDLGGHSLSAGQIVSRVFDHFQLRVPLHVLFQSATIADMAANVAEHLEKRLSNGELADILNELESWSDEESQHHISERLNKNFTS